MEKYFLVTLTFFLLVGCTVVSVQPVVGLNENSTICIVENPRVLLSDFVSVVERRFAYHEIKTKIVANSSECKFTLDYTAERGWDLKPFLDYALLNLRREGFLIGSAEYRNKGGFTITKYAGTATKLNPVIDELLGKSH